MKVKRLLRRLPTSNATRFAVAIIFMGVVAVLLWWRGPSWSAIGDAFTTVRWEWVAAAVGLNLASVVARAIAWRTVIRQAIPPPGEELATTDPRRVLADALSYLRNNAPRMDYPRYRREGLPTTSSLVESLVGEFNARVKGKQKFWNRPGGAEAMLQVRAALLSEDGRLERYFAERPGSPYRRRAA